MDKTPQNRGQRTKGQAVSSEWPVLSRQSACCLSILQSLECFCCFVALSLSNGSLSQKPGTLSCLPVFRLRDKVIISGSLLEKLFLQTCDYLSKFKQWEQFRNVSFGVLKQMCCNRTSYFNELICSVFFVQEFKSYLFFPTPPRSHFTNMAPHA